MSRTEQLDPAGQTALLREARAECDALRRMLYATHPCPEKTAVNGDLRCDECGIDFRRDDLVALERGIQQPSLRWLGIHQNDVCIHCGVTRMTWDSTERVCPNGAGHEWKTP